MRTRRPWIVCLALLVGCAAEQRDIEPPEEAQVALPGAIEDRLYSAALVLDHQAALELDDAQIEAIRAELQDAQRELVDLEVALRRERESLARLLASERVDEATSMEAAALVIERESAIKLLHLRVLIRIKNHLTPAQQRRLDALRR